MSASRLYRAAAALLVLAAAGHTFGFLSFTASTPEGRATWDMMQSVHFRVSSGAMVSYRGFYLAFGLSISAYLLFAAFVAWRLSRIADRALGWAFFAVQAASFAISYAYLAGAPVISFGLVAACSGFAAWQSSRNSGAETYRAPLPNVEPVGT